MSTILYNFKKQFALYYLIQLFSFLCFLYLPFFTASYLKTLQFSLQNKQIFFSTLKFCSLLLFDLGLFTIVKYLSYRFKNYLELNINLFLTEVIYVHSNKLQHALLEDAKNLLLKINNKKFNYFLVIENILHFLICFFVIITSFLFLSYYFIIILISCFALFFLFFKFSCITLKNREELNLIIVKKEKYLQKIKNHSANISMLSMNNFFEKKMDTYFKQLLSKEKEHRIFNCSSCAVIYFSPYFLIFLNYFIFAFFLKKTDLINIASFSILMSILFYSFVKSINIIEMLPSFKKIYFSLIKIYHNAYIQTAQKTEPTRGTEQIFTLNFSYNKEPLLIGIVGIPASANSQFIFSLLKERVLKNENYMLDYGAAFRDYEPFHGTIRENIILGADYKYDSYIEVLRLCCLKDDLSNFDDFDEHILDVKKYNYSPNFLKKIALAQLAYSEAKIFFFEEVFSNLTKHESIFIFKELIQKKLKNSTRFISSQNLELISLCDQILVVQDDVIVEQGNHKELIEKSGYYSQLLYAGSAFSNSITFYRQNLLPNQLHSTFHLATDSRRSDSDSLLKIEEASKKLDSFLFLKDLSGSGFNVLVSLVLFVIIFSCFFIFDSPGFFYLLSMSFFLLFMQTYRPNFLDLFSKKINHKLKLKHLVKYSQYFYSSQLRKYIFVKMNDFIRNFFSEKLKNSVYFRKIMVLHIIMYLFSLISVIFFVKSRSSYSIHQFSLTIVLFSVWCMSMTNLYTNFKGFLRIYFTRSSLFDKRIFFLPFFKIKENSYNKKYSPSEFWPKYGSIEFQEVNFQNEGFNLLSKNFTASIPHGLHFVVLEKNKNEPSLLFKALFSNMSYLGRILIDSVDISSIESQDVKNRLGYISGNSYIPFLTLRENLNSQEKFSESEIWFALNGVGLAHSVALLKDGLDTIIDKIQNGFFTALEMVLFSVARCIIQKHKIILIDFLGLSHEDELKLCTILNHFFQNTTIIFCSQSNVYLSFCNNNCILLEA